MSTWRTPRCDSASTTADCTAGVEPIVPLSPMPLAPSGFTSVGVSIATSSKLGQLGGGDGGVVGQVRGDRVAVVVVAHLLEQRLGGALGDAAVALPVGEQRVEDAAGVVDGDVAHQLDAPGLGVDVDHRHVGAERERGRRRPGSR